MFSGKSFLGLAIATILVLSSACSGTIPTTSSQTPTQPVNSPQTKINITMWLFPISGADDNAYYDPVIKAYEDSHPNVNVEIQWIPGEKRQELYLASITGGTPPDVFLMNSDTFATYADSGALLDMSSYWSQGELSDFYPNVIQDSSWLGKLYMIPTDVSSTPVIYNKDMFKAAGLDPEKPPTNWDEFLSDCEVLTIDKNGKHYGETGFDASNVVQWCTSTPLGTSFLAFKWNPWFFQAGGTYFSADGKTVLFDSQAGLDALNMIVKLADNFMPPSDKTAQYGEDITNFEQLRAAMIPCIENYAAGVIATDVPGLNFGLGPVLKNKVQVSHGAETGYSISATTKNPEAVVELIKFLTSTETLDKYNVYAGSPATRKSVAEAIQSQVPWWLAYGIGQVQYSRSVASPKIEVVWEDMAKEEQAAVLHQKTTEQALKDATDEINAALQQ